MSKKEAIKKRINDRKDRAVTLARGIYHGEETLHGAWRTIVNAAKVLIVAGRKFIKDECFTRASSITYTIILSLVPILAVGPAIYSLYSGVGKNKKELFDQVLLLMAQYNISMNIDPIIDTILGLVENAGKIGGVSAAVMIFSATALFRSLENSLNAIWKVKKGRHVHLQVIFYWAALTLGIILLASGYVRGRAALGPHNALERADRLPGAFCLHLAPLPAGLHHPAQHQGALQARGARGVLHRRGVGHLHHGLHRVRKGLRRRHLRRLRRPCRDPALPPDGVRLFPHHPLRRGGGVHADVSCNLPEPEKGLQRQGRAARVLRHRPAPHIYRKFEIGRRAHIAERAREGGRRQGRGGRLLSELFLDGKLIMQDDNGSYLPSTSSAHIG